VRVNAICPGIIDTSRMDDIGREAVWEQMIKAMIPLGRAGTPADAAGAIYLFCAPESDYISGEVVVAAGGLRT